MTSSATAPGDWEVPSADIFQGRLCLISITRGDGTPMDASSISEGDIMEICVKKGHTCPLGVAQLFGNAICCPFWYCRRLKMSKSQFSRQNGVVKWCHHGHNFSSFRGPYCLIHNGLAFKVLIRGWRAAHSSPTNSPKWGNTTSSPSRAWWPQWPWALTACRRPAPQQPPPNEWVCPSGSREAQGGWPGGHLSRRGKVGPTEAIHSSYRAANWRKGSLWTTPVATMSCTGRTRCGAINYCPNIGSAHSTPKISTFSGNMAPGKTEVSYEQWSHGVQCIKDHYPESVVRESIMRSLKGQQQIWLTIWALLPVSPKF